jgi:hypothetical protein
MYKADAWGNYQRRQPRVARAPKPLPFAAVDLSE